MCLFLVIIISNFIFDIQHFIRTLYIIGGFIHSININYKLWQSNL